MTGRPFFENDRGSTIVRPIPAGRLGGGRPPVRRNPGRDKGRRRRRAGVTRRSTRPVELVFVGHQPPCAGGERSALSFASRISSPHRFSDGGARQIRVPPAVIPATSVVPSRLGGLERQLNPYCTPGAHSFGPKEVLEARAPHSWRCWGGRLCISGRGKGKKGGPRTDRPLHPGVGGTFGDDRSVSFFTETRDQRFTVAAASIAFLQNQVGEHRSRTGRLVRRGERLLARRAEGPLTGARGHRRRRSWRAGLLPRIRARATQGRPPQQRSDPRLRMENW